MSPAPDVDRLVAELRARVEQRRASGAYPPGMEDELDAHFRRVVSHRRPRAVDRLHDQMAAVRAAVDFDTARITTESSAPGGQVAHRLVGKATARQIEGVLAQVRQFAEAVRTALDDLVAAIDDPAFHVHGDLAGQLDALEERVAALERRVPDSNG